MIAAGTWSLTWARSGSLPGKAVWSNCLTGTGMQRWSWQEGWGARIKSWTTFKSSACDASSSSSGDRSGPKLSLEGL